MKSPTVDPPTLIPRITMKKCNARNWHWPAWSKFTHANHDGVWSMIGITNWCANAVPRSRFLTMTLSQITGLCGPKCLYGYVNSWVPAILLNARCNNNGKFLTSGADTKNITFYVTSYAAKKQGKNYNVSAIMADGYAYHLEHPKPEYIDSIRDQQRLLLFHLIHSINREQELAGPMVISYLMGWGVFFLFSHLLTDLLGFLHQRPVHHIPRALKASTVRSH